MSDEKIKPLLDNYLEADKLLDEIKTILLHIHDDDYAVYVILEETPLIDILCEKQKQVKTISGYTTDVLIVKNNKNKEKEVNAQERKET